ncbi:MAG: hypothetical protein AAGN82_12860 [Myxococcota bacterium]
MTFPSGLRIGVWALALIGGASVAACDADLGTTNRNETEVEACDECQAILVECTSTSQDEQQFVACRDQWLTCQQQRNLGPDDCRNPGDSQACGLCQERRAGCVAGEDADEAVCDVQFGVCKAFLITRGDVRQQCTSTPGPSPDEVGCTICRQDLGTCVSDPTGETTLEVCTTKFGDCLSAHQVDAGQCSPPTGAEGCTLCTEYHASCAASGEATCATGFALCAEHLQAASCALPDDGAGGAGGGDGVGGAGGGGDTSTGGGSSGEGGGDGTGGGGTTTTCPGFDGCSSHGPGAVPQSCNACTQAVCAADDYCCLTHWDTLCATAAASEAACGCTVQI